MKYILVVFIAIALALSFLTTQHTPSDATTNQATQRTLQQK